MSRSGYSEDGDYDQWEFIKWRGAVTSALRGKRGQAFLREMLAALDAMPIKELIAHELVNPDGQACAIGVVAKARGRGDEFLYVDPEDRDTVAAKIGLAPAMVAEIVYMNDDYWPKMDPASRFTHMRSWIERQLIEPATSTA